MIVDTRQLLCLLSLFYCCFGFLDAPKVVTVLGIGDEPAADNPNGYSAKYQYFEPRETTIFEGDSVLWKWEGMHNVAQSFDAKSNQTLFDSHQIEGFGAETRVQGQLFWTFEQAGDYYFICEPHVECCDMRGVIHVKPRPTPLQAAPGGSGSAHESVAAAGPPVNKGPPSFLSMLALGNKAANAVAPAPPPKQQQAAATSAPQVVQATAKSGQKVVNGDLVRQVDNGMAEVEQSSSHTLLIVLLLCVGCFALAVFGLAQRRQSKRRSKHHIILHSAPGYGRFNIE